MKTHQPQLAHAILAAVLGLCVAAPAMAQSGPGDPPARVGRLAQAFGAVSFHAADDDQWQAATANYPVTSGNSFWTEPGAHAAIDVGASRIYLDSSTELDIGTLDDRTLVASLAQGVVFLRVPDASNYSQYEIDTPRAAVRIAQPGQYEIVAGDTDNPTRVIAFDGSAQVVGQGIDTVVAPGQALYISGQGPFSVGSGAAQQDGFSQFVQNEERPYFTTGQAPVYVSPQETGYRDLARYGQWQQTPNYGPVWMPRQVAADWAPYRDGHWAYVVPWGWTWVDNAPWGFTPFHYGRWVKYHHRWVWLPGQVVQQPVYAPALVNFFGGFNLGNGVAIGITIGSAVGWVPLGPEEVYVPPYRSSPRYVRNVNITNVHNETTIINIVNNKTVINNYINRDATTVASAADMANSRQIGPEFRKLPKDRLQQDLTKATPLGSQAPVKPTYATAGVTPAVARTLGAGTPPSGTAANRQLAPGPVVATGQMGANGQGTNRRLPLLKKGIGTATNGNNATGTTTAVQNPAPGPAAVQNKNLMPPNGTGQPPLLKKGTGTATNGNNTGGNATATQNPAPGPAVVQDKSTTPQNGTGQPPLLKNGTGTATNGNDTGGNATAEQNPAPGPAIVQDKSATPQNGTGQPPLLTKRNSTTPNGENSASHPTLAPTKRSLQPKTNLPPLPKAGSGAAPSGHLGKVPAPDCNSAGASDC